jgi:tryptophan synthase alpha chain
MNGTPRKAEPAPAVARTGRAAARGPIPSPHPPTGMSTVDGESAPERADSVPDARAGKTLAVYLMAGRETPELAEAAVEGGADLVELGFPFSDPLADGPVIRRAAEQALARGMRTHACLECLAAVRQRVDVPLVPMTYAALLEAYGYERFAADAEAAGATSLIVADLPTDVRPELRRVQLVAPTSTDERLALAAARTDGWLYLVTVAGTTGPRERLSPALAGLAGRARQLTDLPLYAGFGIGTPEQARAAAELTDGVVVGSRAVELAEEGPRALRDYVRSLRVAIDANVGIIGRP